MPGCSWKLLGPLGFRELRLGLGFRIWGLGFRAPWVLGFEGFGWEDLDSHSFL